MFSAMGKVSSTRAGSAAEKGFPGSPDISTAAAPSMRSFRMTPDGGRRGTLPWTLGVPGESVDAALPGATQVDVGWTLTRNLPRASEGAVLCC